MPLPTRVVVQGIMFVCLMSVLLSPLYTKDTLYLTKNKKHLSNEIEMCYWHPDLCLLTNLQEILNLLVHEFCYKGLQSMQSVWFVSFNILNLKQELKCMLVGPVQIHVHKLLHIVDLLKDKCFIQISYLNTITTILGKPTQGPLQYLIVTVYPIEIMYRLRNTSPFAQVAIGVKESYWNYLMLIFEISCDGGCGKSH